MAGISRCRLGLLYSRTVSTLEVSYDSYDATVTGVVGPLSLVGAASVYEQFHPVTVSLLVYRRH